MSKTESLLNKLRDLAEKAGESIFERAALAQKILDDKQWIAGPQFKGDAGAAEDYVAVECFPELSKAFGLGMLLTLRRVFPDIATWREHKFNLVHLWARYEEMQEKEPKPKKERQVVTKKELAEKEEKVEELQYHLKRSEESVQTKDQRIAQLEAENRKLWEENAVLKGRIMELERRVEMVAA